MSCGCPDKYSLNEATGFCEKIVRTQVDVNENPFLPTGLVTTPSYMRYGTLVFPKITSVQYPITLLSTLIPRYSTNNGIELTGINILAGDLWISSSTLNKGRLNQAGIGLLAPIDQWQGYARCVTVDEGDIISVAVTSTRAFRVYVDGVLVVLANPNWPARLSDYLHVIPLELEVGNHTIRVEGYSDNHASNCVDENGIAVQCSSDSAVLGDNLGGFVFELYKNVSAQILADIKDQDQLNQYYALHTVNGVKTAITTLLLQGGPTDTGVHGNYLCDHHLDNSIEGAYYCVQTLQVSPGACCFTLVNCVTGVQLSTNSDLTEYLDNTVKIEEYSGCFLVVINNTVGCPGAVPVTVIKDYNTCLDCTKIYYKLVDCRGEIDSLFTDYNLSAHVGKVITISGYNACWIVVIEGDADKPLVDLTLVSSYDNCEQCL